MRRCLHLAGNGVGRTSPNPMVGALVVREGAIVAEGWHDHAGGPHAEVVALSRCPDAAGATLYVSLEPCCHHGRTPPCTDLIIACGLRRVVVACADPFAAVSGNGIRQLRDHGIEVAVGVCESEARWLNRRFFCAQQRHRPYVTLKVARHADGSMGRRGEHTLISNAWCQRQSHRLRASEDAILVGGATARIDQPALNTRLWPGHNPLRVILSPSLEVPAQPPGTLIVGGDGPGDDPTGLYRGGALGADARTCRVPFDGRRPAARQVLEAVQRAGCQSLIVEGGPTTLRAFLDEGLWDEAYEHVALTGGAESASECVMAPAIEGETVDVERYDDCAVLHKVRV